MFPPGRHGVLSPLPSGLPSTLGRPRRCLPVASTALGGVRNSRIACGERTITPLSGFFFFHFSSKCWVALEHSWRYCVEPLLRQRFLCSLSAAPCIGKFHPLTLGLCVTIAEIIDRAHSTGCKGRDSRGEWERQSLPHKGGVNQCSEPERWQVTNPQGPENLPVLRSKMMPI